MSHYYSENPDSKSSRSEKISIVGNKKYYFLTDSGVFSRGGLDYGSRFLIETIPKITGKVLDIGCGYGPIGIILGDTNDISVTMSDINNRALELCELNIKRNKVNANIIHSDMYENIKGKFDYIITNPPIRVGKVKLLEILNLAKKYLNHDGELWFVIRKKQGAESVIKILKDVYDVKIIKKSKGFYIIKCLPIDL